MTKYLSPNDIKILWFLLLILILLSVFISFRIVRLSRIKKAKAKTSSTNAHQSHPQSTPELFAAPQEEPMRSAAGESEEKMAAPPAAASEYGLSLVNTATLEKIPIGKLPLTIGRGKDQAIVVNDPAVSSAHARLFYHPLEEVVCIEDLGAQNGILINGKPTLRNVLETGDQITLGETVFTFQNTGYLHDAE